MYVCVEGIRCGLRGWVGLIVCVVSEGDVVSVRVYCKCENKWLQAGIWCLRECGVSEMVCCELEVKW